MAIIFNGFILNILITGSFFTTSTIQRQWHLYDIVYSKAIQTSLIFADYILLFYACGNYDCVSNSAILRNKDVLHINTSHQICKYGCAGKTYLHIYIPRVSSDPIHQWFSNLAREIHFPAEFSSNPDQTHLPGFFQWSWRHWLACPGVFD